MFDHLSGQTYAHFHNSRVPKCSCPNKITERGDRCLDMLRCPSLEVDGECSKGFTQLDATCDVLRSLSPGGADES
jgi:hypothetical protein